MNKMYLMKNPEVFQGEKYLNSNKDYFEGWYFKNSNNEKSISFIPGINIEEGKKKSFVQIITNEKSYFIKYDIKDFEFSFEPFYIKIGNNVFSKDGIKINIEDKNQNIKINGKLKYSEIKEINKDALNPNIMGPFSYVPFMECNHAILSMKNKIAGSLNINSKKMDFTDGTGYIEKDWGVSFPKDYIWCQGNNFNSSNSSFMISVADIPFKIFNFKGLICDLIIEGEEYKFATYNNSKVIKCDIKENNFDITLKKDNYYLDICSIYNNNNNNNNNSSKLYAPVKGKMDKDIVESISSTIRVTLKEDEKIIFSDISKNCGIEIVK